MILIDNKRNQDLLIKFLNEEYDLFTREISYIKKEILKGELKSFKCKSYYMLTYTYLEVFYRNFGQKLIEILGIQDIRYFKDYISSKLKDQPRRNTDFIFTRNNVYIKVLNKEYFLNAMLKKDITSLDSFIKQKEYIKNIYTIIPNDFTKKLKFHTELRNKYTHERSAIEDKKSINELIQLIEDFFGYLAKWIEGKNE